MTQILKDTSVSALTKAIWENILGFALIMQRWPRAELHDENGITWAITDIPFPLFNVVFRTQLDAARLKTVIEKITGEAQKRQVPILWEVWPSAKPRDLAEHLEKHGFVASGKPPGMALDLNQLHEDAPPVPGLTIQRVETSEDMQAFMQAWGAGYETPEFVTEPMKDFFQHAPENKLFSYLARKDGQPVATSQVLFHAGIAGLYSVATVPEARRQGIGTQIVLAALREARSLGYRVSILHSSKMGLNLYRTLGFREYFKFARYVRTPEEVK